jgi:uncharacterized membrane protein
MNAAPAMTKTLSFAAVHFTVAFTLAYLISGSLLTGGLIALIEPCCNTLAYHLHEKFWARPGRPVLSPAHPSG